MAVHDLDPGAGDCWAAGDLALLVGKPNRFAAALGARAGGIYTVSEVVEAFDVAVALRFRDLPHPPGQHSWAAWAFRKINPLGKDQIRAELREMCGDVLAGNARQ
jgi:hypothetical protein